MGCATLALRTSSTFIVWSAMAQVPRVLFVRRKGAKIFLQLTRHKTETEKYDDARQNSARIQDDTASHPGGIG